MTTPSGPSVTHPFDADPDSSLPGVYCRCGLDADVHADKGNATVVNGRYVMPTEKGSDDA